MLRRTKIFCGNLAEFIFLYVLRHIFREIINKDNNTMVMISSTGLGDFILHNMLFERVSKNNQLNLNLVLRSEYTSLYSGTAKVISFNKNRYKYNLIYRFKLILMIRGLRPHLVINLNRGRTYYDDQISLASGAKNILASGSIPENYVKLFKKRVDQYYHIISQSLSEYEKLKDILNYLGCSEISSSQNFQSVLKPGKIRIIIAPFASHSIKEWPVENFISLIAWLTDQLQYDVTLIGLKKTRSIPEDFNNFTNLINKLSILEVKKLLPECSLFIGNDSGFAHMAKALGVPRIILAGGGSIGHYWPYNNTDNEAILHNEINCSGCEWICKYKEAVCLTSISIDSVKNKIFEFLPSEKL